MKLSTLVSPRLHRWRIRPAAAPATETAVLAGGCFWGMEGVFEHVKGVTDVVSGYAGGSAGRRELRQGQLAKATGHAEAVRISYDPGASQLRAAAAGLLHRRARPDRR